MENIDKTLAELAQKFGVKAEELWPALVGYEKTSNLIGVVVGSVLAVLALVLFAVAVRAALQVLRLEKSNKSTDGASSVAFASACLGCVLLVLSIVAVASALPGYLYPEAAAVIRLVGR